MLISWHKMNLDFTKLDGLVPAVIQDHTSGRVLMVGFMNEEAFRRTVETGFATFYSRSRKKLWMKGESSGHRLAVKEISIDCDQARVEALGPGVCHNGYRSCFAAWWRVEGIHQRRSRAPAREFCRERSTGIVAIPSGDLPIDVPARLGEHSNASALGAHALPSPIQGGDQKDPHAECNAPVENTAVTVDVHEHEVHGRIGQPQDRDHGKLVDP